MVKELSNLSEFQSAVASPKLTVVKFSAVWCGPCQAFAPIFAQMANTYTQAQFVKTDVDKARDIAQHCRIRAMPTIQLYKSGQKLGEVVGANKAKLEQLIQQHGGAFSAFGGSGRSLGKVEGYKNPWADEREKDIKERQKKKEQQKQQQQQPKPVPKEDDMIDEDMDPEALEALLKKKERALKRGPTLLDKANETFQKEMEGKEYVDLSTKEAAVEFLKKSGMKVEHLDELLSMEFPLIRALKGLVNTGGQGVAQAVDWICQNQNNKAIDEPLQIRMETEEDKKRRHELQSQAIKEQAKINRQKREKERKKKVYEDEIKRRKDGIHMEEQRQKFADQQKILQREQAKKEKAELKAAKKRMKRLAKMDKLQRKIERLQRTGGDPFELNEAQRKLAKLQGVTPPEKKVAPQPTQSKPVQAQSSSQPTNQCRLRIRMLNGEVMTVGFNPQDTLGKVYSHIQQFQNQSFVFMTNFPRKVYNDHNMTLTQAGLVPSGQLICTVG